MNNFYFVVILILFLFCSESHEFETSVVFEKVEHFFHSFHRFCRIYGAIFRINDAKLVILVTIFEEIRNDVLSLKMGIF